MRILRILLVVLLFGSAISAGAVGAMTLDASESVVHEIEALICSLISTTAFGLGTIGLFLDGLIVAAKRRP